jgi:hypothetical protein
VGVLQCLSITPPRPPHGGLRRVESCTSDIQPLPITIILSAVSSWRNSPPRGGEYLHRVTADSISILRWI